VKAIVVLVAAFGLPYSVIGQGQFVFNSYVPPDIDARFVDSLCPGMGNPLGAGWEVQLLGGLTGTPFPALEPLDPSFTTFKTGIEAGFVVPTTETVPGVPQGLKADVWLRVVYAQNPSLGLSWLLGPFTITLGGGLVPPPNLPLGNSLLGPVEIGNCPEPSPLRLAFVGLLVVGLHKAVRTRQYFLGTLMTDGN
jgi:hypothetical protein